jgi:tripartite-type tricarboxylate transporter receptor subunit TctC
MKLPHRRQFLHLAAATAALPALSTIARAQAYPTRPVRIIVGFPAGGSGDFHARLMGQWLSERLGSNSSSTTGRVPAATLAQRQSSVHRPTAIYAPAGLNTQRNQRNALRQA